MDNAQVYAHPSYGMISFNRYCGGDTEFFGSSIKHDGGIELTVSIAEQERYLSKDWYFPKKAVLRLRMTETQFAQAITHMNTSGTPCTLEYFNGEYIEQPNGIINKRLEFQDEFNKEMKRIGSELVKFQKSADELLTSKKNMTKTDKEELAKLLEHIVNQVSSNLPFIAESFNETMESIVTEAKDEVEQFVERKVRATGIDTLKANLIAEQGGSHCGKCCEDSRQ